MSRCNRGYIIISNIILSVAKRIKDKPGVDNKDKKIKLWLIGHRPLLAQGLEESGCMLQFLDNTSGPSPLSVISQCYKQLGLILLKEKVEVRRCKF